MVSKIKLEIDKIKNEIRELVEDMEENGIEDRVLWDKWVMNGWCLKEKG